jgi:TonB family protein
MSKPDTWKSWEGLVIKGKFPLRQWLGGSDHSAVFLTEFADQHAQRAAIKLIQVDEGDAETRLSRLRATAKLSHPHLIRTFECGVCRLDGSPFLYAVMECADDDLSQIIPERPLHPSEVTDLLPPVLDALFYLHKNGFVHGRIKPSNVLAAGDQLKLSTDQVAPVAQQDGARRRRDVYDAPETAAGIISPAGDIWSVGVTLLASLTQSVTAAEQASPANRDLPETIPDPFRGIVRECLQLDPNRRCSLKEIQARMQPGARSVPAPPEPASPVHTSHYRLTWRMLIPIAILLVAALSWRLMYKPSLPPASVNFQISQARPESSQAAPAQVIAAPKPVEPVAKARGSAGEVVRKVLPDVPRSAQHTIRGTIKVVVRVQVDVSGKVSAATLKSPGSSRYFANQALKAAERWEFSAPEVDGQPTVSTWLLQFRFKRTSIEASPQREKG